MHSRIFVIIIVSDKLKTYNEHRSRQQNLETAVRMHKEEDLTKSASGVIVPVWICLHKEVPLPHVLVFVPTVNHKNIVKQAYIGIVCQLFY